MKLHKRGLAALSLMALGSFAPAQSPIGVFDLIDFIPQVEKNYLQFLSPGYGISSDSTSFNVFDRNGNMYGVSSGQLWKLTPASAFSVLHLFGLPMTYPGGVKGSDGFDNRGPAIEHRLKSDGNREAGIARRIAIRLRKNLHNP